MKITREKIYGWTGSVIFGVLILLILIFTIIKTVVPPEDEGGVLVNFGNVDEAAGTFEPAGTEMSTPIIPPPTGTDRQPATEELVTQDNEESLALAREKKREEQEKAEEERKQREEERRRQNIQNQVSGAFGAASSSTSTSQGTGTGTGNQGSPQGNSDTGANSGVGGYGSFSLEGRSLGGEGLPRPAYSIQQEGAIVVNITVNPQGNVIYTAIGRGTNIDNESMRRSALDAAKRAKFNTISGTNNQSGTITYRYKLK